MYHNAVHSPCSASFLRSASSLLTVEINPLLGPSPHHCLSARRGTPLARRQNSQKARPPNHRKHSNGRRTRTIGVHTLTAGDQMRVCVRAGKRMGARGRGCARCARWAGGPAVGRPARVRAHACGRAGRPAIWWQMQVVLHCMQVLALRERERVRPVGRGLLSSSLVFTQNFDSATPRRHLASQAPRALLHHIVSKIINRQLWRRCVCWRCCCCLVSVVSGCMCDARSRIGGGGDTVCVATWGGGAGRRVHSNVALTVPVGGDAVSKRARRRRRRAGNQTIAVPAPPYGAGGEGREGGGLGRGRQGQPG